MKFQKRIALVVTMLFVLATQAEAGPFGRRRSCPPQGCPQSAPAYAPAYRVYAPAYRTTTTTTQYRSTTTTTTDPAGFLGWLNGYRASRGLRPVGWDPGLAAEAAANNAQQRRRGLGHFFMGSARRQNSAMGGDPAAMWAASPAHNSALLDPSVTLLGLAGDGAYWTANLR